MHASGNLTARTLVSDAITALPLENVNLLLREWEMFLHVHTNWDLNEQNQYRSSKKWTQTENGIRGK